MCVARAITKVREFLRSYSKRIPSESNFGLPEWLPFPRLAMTNHTHASRGFHIHGYIGKNLTFTLYTTLLNLTPYI